MSKIHHPIRDQEVSVYHFAGGCPPKEPDEFGRTDRDYIAFFSDYQKYPIYFQGPSLEECRDRAIAFRDSEADKNEKHYRTRIEALRKARKAKGKK